MVVFWVVTQGSEVRCFLILKGSVLSGWLSQLVPLKRRNIYATLQGGYLHSCPLQDLRYDKYPSYNKNKKQKINADISVFLTLSSLVIITGTTRFDIK